VQLRDLSDCFISSVSQFYRVDIPHLGFIFILNDIYTLSFAIPMDFNCFNLLLKFNQTFVWYL